MDGQQPFRTIKALVIDHIERYRGLVDPSVLEAEVRTNFPHSKWKNKHWSYYRNQFTKGRLQGQISPTATQNLQKKAAGTPAMGTPVRTAPGRQENGNNNVKRLGDAILQIVRSSIASAAKDDMDLQFKLNRWVFARLLQDEIRIKRPIKRALWESGIRYCCRCRRQFPELKNVEIHRKDRNIGYSQENCELICRSCHEKES